MPVVGQFLPQQHDVARGERANVVANEPRASPRGEQRQFHLLVVMPVGAFTGDPIRLVGVQEAFNVKEFA